jgi:urea transporter
VSHFAVLLALARYAVRPEDCVSMWGILPESNWRRVLIVSAFACALGLANALSYDHERLWHGFAVAGPVLISQAIVLAWRSFRRVGPPR